MRCLVWVVLVAACSSEPDPAGELADLEARATSQCHADYGTALDELADSPDVYCINMAVGSAAIPQLHTATNDGVMHEDWFAVDGTIVGLAYRQDSSFRYWQRRHCTSLTVQQNEDQSGGAVYQVAGACTIDYDQHMRL